MTIFERLQNPLDRALNDGTIPLPHGRLRSGTKKTPFVTLRLIEIRSGKIWHSYLTSVLDPEADFSR